MIAKCFYRENVESTIFSGLYDFETGLINGLPSSVFKYKFPKKLYCEYDNAKVTRNENNSDIILRMYKYKAIFITLYYNVGFICVLQDGSVVINFVKWDAADDIYPCLDDTIVLFPYKQEIVGRQSIEIFTYCCQQYYSYLFANTDNNTILTRFGFIKFPEKLKPISKDDIPDIKEFVNVWLKGFDGIISCMDSLYNYKVFKNKVVSAVRR